MNIKEHLEQIKDEINDSFKDSFLSKMQQLSAYDFLFSFSKGKNKNLLISLNLLSPFVMLNEEKFLQNQNEVFFQHLKARILNSYFKEATLVNEDNILSLRFIKTTDTYDKIVYDLVIELFKSNTNMILLADNKIIEAYKYKGLDTHHPILNNMTYVYPDKTIVFKEYSQEEKTKIQNYLSNINTLYLEEKYKDLIVLLKRKRKSLNKKLDNLVIEHDEAIKHEIYKEYGDALKMNFYEVKKGDKELTIDNTTIPLREEFSPSQNLQYFFKIYKKSKATIDSTNKYILETQNQIQYIDNILTLLDTYTDDEYQAILNELKNNGLIKLNSFNNIKVSESAKKPYYILFNNVRFGYGKNSVQNNELTFSLAQKNDSFLHIDKNHGPHIIIFKEDPTDEEIQFACELALYLAKQKDGNVIYSKVMFIKKTPILGKVRMTKYETYHINKVREEMNEFVKNSIRF